MYIGGSGGMLLYCIVNFVILMLLKWILKHINFGSIGSHSSCTLHFVAAAMSSCSKGVGLTIINLLVCVI